MSTSTNTSTNGTTIAPEVAAFVSNSKQLIIAGSVTGGVIVLLIATIIVCCRCIRNRTSDEAKERNRIERKTKFENRRDAMAEDAAKKEARRLKNAGKARRGRVAAYDETLAKSFANLTGIGKQNAEKDDDESSEDDGIKSDGDWDSRLLGQRAAELAGSSSEVGDGGSSSPTRPRALSRTRTVSLMSGTSGAADEAVTVTVDDVSDEELVGAQASVELKSLALPVVARNSGPFVLGGVRRLPLPRSDKEAEILYGHKNSLFDAVIQSHLADERKRLDAAQAARDEIVARRRKAAEARALDVLQVHAALRGHSSTLSAPVVLQDDEDFSEKRQRLTTVSTDDYYSVTL
jgi:hypothetical protein